MVECLMLIISQEVKSLPNIKSAIKRVKVAEIKRQRNAAQMSALRAIIKKCRTAIANNDPSAQQLFANAVKAIDKAAAKDLIHKNTAARKKSQLAKALKAVNSAN